MNDYHNLPSIQSVTPTVCSLFGIEPPRNNQAQPLLPVLRAATTLERLLIYAPDAIGTHFLSLHPNIAAQFHRVAPLEVKLRSMIPPKTPVCFASMFSGAPPEVHGITRYERPVLTIDTLFDALVRAGKRVAIIAVKDSSIDLIFRNRQLDYFSEPYDPEVTTKALQLLKADQHEVILAYHQEYDDLLHRAGPFSETSVAAATRHAESFQRLSEAATEAWSAKKWGICATPDHGGHNLEGTGRGDHGEDIHEDMAVTHFWAFGSR